MTTRSIWLKHETLFSGKPSKYVEEFGCGYQYKNRGQALQKLEALVREAVTEVKQSIGGEPVGVIYYKDHVVIRPLSLWKTLWNGYFELRVNFDL